MDMIKLRHRLLIALLFVIFAMCIVSCGQAESEYVANKPESVPVALNEEEIPEETSPETLPDVVEDNALLEDKPTDYCLECHIDKQMLIDTAAPIEVVESENEGEG